MEIANSHEPIHKFSKANAFAPTFCVFLLAIFLIWTLAENTKMKENKEKDTNLTHPNKPPQILSKPENFLVPAVRPKNENLEKIVQDSVEDLLGTSTGFLFQDLSRINEVQFNRSKFSQSQTKTADLLYCIEKHTRVSLDEKTFSIYLSKFSFLFQKDLTFKEDPFLCKESVYVAETVRIFHQLNGAFQSLELDKIVEFFSKLSIIFGLVDIIPTILIFDLIMQLVNVPKPILFEQESKESLNFSCALKIILNPKENDKPIFYGVHEILPKNFSPPRILTEELAKKIIENLRKSKLGGRFLFERIQTILKFFISRRNACAAFFCRGNENMKQIEHFPNKDHLGSKFIDSENYFLLQSSESGDIAKEELKLEGVLDCLTFYLHTRDFIRAKNHLAFFSAARAGSNLSIKFFSKFTFEYYSAGGGYISLTLDLCTGENYSIQPCFYSLLCSMLTTMNIKDPSKGVVKKITLTVTDDKETICLDDQPIETEIIFKELFWFYMMWIFLSEGNFFFPQFCKLTEEERE